MTEPLWTSSDWNFEKIQRIYDACEEIALKELNLNCYQNQLEIISSEQMLDAYASIGMPIFYQHWSFGKHFVREQQNYQSGRSGLAYELVINSSPCINYLMEDNSMTMQALVIAHAAFGHNHFFKNNYLFKQWTDADSIIDYLVFAREYINKQEGKHGREAVEKWIDSCHALMSYGVNRYKRPTKISMAKEKIRQSERLAYLQTQVSELYRLLPKQKDEKVKSDEDKKKFPKQPEENLLYFFEKFSPDIEEWQREILRIIRKISVYFYPQGQCVTGNHMISTPNGILRFDELISNEGYLLKSNLNMLTAGNKFTAASHTYKRMANVIKITTNTGKTFTGTPEHPLMILRDGKQIMCKLENMTVDDHIVTNLAYDIFSNNNPVLTCDNNTNTVTCQLCGLTSYFIGSHIKQIHNLSAKEYEQIYSESVSTETTRIRKSKNIVKHYPSVMNESVAKFIAFLHRLSFIDGNSVFCFSDNDIKKVELFKELLKDIFDIDQDIQTNQFKKPCIIFSSYTLKKFIIDNFSDAIGNIKSIPILIRTSTKNVVKQYIKTIIDLFSINRTTIGSFSINGYNEHREFLEQMQTLLYGFGIISEIVSNTRQTYAGIAESLGLPLDSHEHRCVDTLLFRILVDHRSLYETTIGSNLTTLPATQSNYTNFKNIIPNAKELLNIVRNKLIADRENFAQIHLSDTMPYQYKLSNHLLVKQNFISTTDLPEIASSVISHSHIAKYKEKFENLNKVSYIPEATELLTLIEESSNTFYDKIAYIEVLEDQQYVYDVTIPENHLFWLDGVISHNTKVMNEGFASMTHYTILNRLHDKGLMTDGAMLEFLHSHSGVLYQPSYDSKRYSGLNPYAFGFAMLRDIQRMCKNPTAEDLRWFPKVKGANAQDLILESVEDFRDESFIRQWLSPAVIRELHLFNVHDDRADKEKYLVTAIHNDKGYETIKENLANQYLDMTMVPSLEVVNVDRKTRAITIQYTENKGRKLGNVDKMFPHIEKLWGGYPVILVDNKGNTIKRSTS